MAANILECENDKTFYTGITTDVNRRLLEHNSGKGAKYTRMRLPVSLRAVFKVKNRSEASREEYRLKKLSRQEKLKLLCLNKQ